jgi:type II secretory pathway pseudopilin PulG
LEDKMQSRFNVRNFGVLEIIMSVAILAAFSVFVLKLFVSASDRGRQARMLDSASFAASGYVEQFKAGAGPYSLMSLPGASAASSAPDDRTVTVAKAADGLSAVIEIKREASPQGLYVINIDMRGSVSGKSVYKLSGCGYFGGQV